MEESTAELTHWVILSTLLHIAAFTGVTFHALCRRRNASATMLWIFVAWTFPVFGPLCYLAFGIDRIPNKALQKKTANQLMLHHRKKLYNELAPFKAWHLGFRSKMTELDTTLSRKLNRAIGALDPEHPLLDGNNITPLISGDQAYPLMLQSIRTAQKHIHLQSFIIHRDETGRQFLDELKAKAEQGVQVRLLFDRFGSTKAYLSGMFRSYRSIPNFEICGWTQANPLKAQFQINLRNHRKSLIVDGHTAYFGGVNIATENTTGRGKNAIRDYHFKVEGPLVHELQYSFLRDWFFMTAEPIEQLLNGAHFPEMLSIGQARARLINSGPTSAHSLINEAYFNAIIMAEKQILIVTPYFVPTVDILQALRSAAQRGVDIRIIVPKHNNHRYAGMAAKALFEELLEVGVRIFQRNPPFLHAKAMIIDDAVALVGTANLDVRSLELNYETTVLFEHENTVNQLKEIVLDDISKSTEINLHQWTKRPALQKFGENLCSLMTPVL